MRKIIITLCGLGLGVLSLTAQDRQDIVPPLAGWSYFGGDELPSIEPCGDSMGIRRKTILTRHTVTILGKVWHKLNVIKW